MENQTPNPNIGALWEKFTKAGQPYFTGNVEINNEKIKIVVFKNNKKSKDTQPDYHILISKPPHQQQETIPSVSTDDLIF
jgi:uncharacterized protein (DUF736 family)